MFQTKVVEKIKAHIYASIFFFFENLAVYDIMWKNIVKSDRPQMTVWHVRIACWIPKATNTHSEYVVLIALPLQQWLHERASVVRYTHIACLVLRSQDLFFSHFHSLLDSVQPIFRTVFTHPYIFPLECVKGRNLGNISKYVPPPYCLDVTTKGPPQLHNCICRLSPK